MAQDYYKVLGVEKTASADEIKSAYRRLAKKYHPDVYATASAEEKANAETKFKEIQHAYDVLSDPQKRSAFDQFGSEDGPTGGGGFGGFNPFQGGQGFNTQGFGDIFGDIFSAFAGGGGARSRTSARQGDDIEVGLQLDFKEACFGVEKEITYTRVENCPSCKGTGAKNGTAFKVCTKCGGKGRVVVQQRTMLGVMQTERVCDMCGGSGKIITDACPDCKGKGRVRKQRTIKVKIPAGIDNNQMLTMQNEGNAGINGGPNGNLVIIFKVKPHPLFVRQGNDLNMELPISVTQAILGDTVEIPTLTGSVKIEIPEGTQDGAVIRVKNKGVKNLRRDSYGDLYVRVTIDVPKNLGSRQRKQLEELKEILDKGRYDKIEKYRKKLKEL